MTMNWNNYFKQFMQGGIVSEATLLFHTFNTSFPAISNTWFVPFFLVGGIASIIIDKVIAIR